MSALLATWLALSGGPVEAEEEPTRVVVTDLGAGTAPASAALDVNSNGNVVGHTYEPETGASEPVGWHGQTMTTLSPFADAQRGRAFEINDRDQIIGALDGGGRSHAALWDPETGEATLIRPDALFSAAVDLNAQGDVLIWYLVEGPGGQPEQRIAIWGNGHERIISPADPEPTNGDAGATPGPSSNAAPGDGNLRPVALNDQGAVALTLDGPDGEPAAAYHWADGELTDLGSLGGGGTSAVAIDQHGRIAGTSVTAEGAQRAFIWQDGTMQDLGTLGGSTSQVAPSRDAMSDASHIIGTSVTAEGAQRAFIWQDGTMQDLGTLGGADVKPMAVNDRGQVAGNSSTGDGGQHAFLWDGQEMIDLGTLGGELSQAQALNDLGQVVGHSRTASGDHHAVMWTVPQ